MSLQVIKIRCESITLWELLALECMQVLLANGRGLVGCSRHIQHIKEPFSQSYEYQHFLNIAQQHPAIGHSLSRRVCSCCQRDNLLSWAHTSTRANFKFEFE
jgi:hypothetical protein